MANLPIQIHEFPREFNALSDPDYLPASSNSLTGKITIQNLKDALGVGTPRSAGAIALSADYTIAATDPTIILFRPTGAFVVTMPAIGADPIEHEVFIDTTVHQIEFIDGAGDHLLLLGGNSQWTHFSAFAVDGSWLIRPGGEHLIV